MIQVTSQGAIQVKGEITLDTTAALWQQSQSLFATLPNAVHVDLQEVTHSDSAGVALLTAWLRLARNQNKEIFFSHMPEQMQAIVRVSGLEKILLTEKI